MQTEPEIIPPSRSAAKAIGAKEYFTGKPCKYGHIALRGADDGSCKVCKSLYYEQNAERIKAKSKKWWSDLKNAPKEKQDAVRKRNTEYMKRKRNEDFAFNERQREVSRKVMAKWRVINRERHLFNARISKLKRRKSEGSYTLNDLKSMLESQNWECASCKANLHETGYHVDHIMPVSRGGTNWPENLQCLCPPCNLSKWAKTPDEWEAYKSRKASNG